MKSFKQAAGNRVKATTANTENDMNDHKEDADDNDDDDRNRNNRVPESKAKLYDLLYKILNEQATIGKAWQIVHSIIRHEQTRQWYIHTVRGVCVPYVCHLGDVHH